MLEVKETWKRQRDGSNTSTGFIVQVGALWRGTPPREIEPTATHRLGLVVEGYWKSRGKSQRNTIAG
jgi:hypothetical protein